MGVNGVSSVIRLYCGFTMAYALLICLLCCFYFTALGKFGESAVQLDSLENCYLMFIAQYKKTPEMIATY